MRYAKVIKHSTFQGREVCSIETRGHRFTLAELNTHRLISKPRPEDLVWMLEEFSRNSASSRAIPVKKQIEMLRESIAYPVSWPQEQKGMQGGEPLGAMEQEQAVSYWDGAAEDAIAWVETLVDLGLHKSVTNRLLEPFMEHTVLLTATNWQGFFDQRLDENAQPEIREQAEMILAAMAASKPTELLPGQWHLPYVEDEDIDSVEKHLLDTKGQGNYGSSHVTHHLVKLSTARSARTSYLTMAGVRDVIEDFALYDRLVTAKPTHFSPAEHPCTPDISNEQATRVYPRFEGSPGGYEYVGPRYGNLVGYHQHRFDLMGSAA